MAELVRVFFTDIKIHDTDEDNSEWRLDYGANIGAKDIRSNFYVDGVSDGDKYNLFKEALFTANRGDVIHIYTDGYEEDDPGFPIFDLHDPLPRINEYVDPFALPAGVDNVFNFWASAGSFIYTLSLTVNHISVPWI